MKLLSQMTEEELKTLCNSIKNEYTNNSSVTLKQSDFDNMWKTIDKQTEQINRLQEQLNEANEVIKEYAKKSSWLPTEKRRDLWAFPEEGYLLAKKYLGKWGVK